MGMTVGEHTELLKAALQSLPGINNNLKKQEQALRVSNAIACAKELHTLGVMSDEEYKKSLVRFVEASGFTMV